MLAICRFHVSCVVLFLRHSSRGVRVCVCVCAGTVITCAAIRLQLRVTSCAKVFIPTLAFQPQLTSRRGVTMASKRCASRDCRCQPSGACSAPGGPFCGQHCACPGHGRRTQRGGTTRGAPSWAERRLAATRHETTQVIGEAVDYLWCHEYDWCRRFEARSPTGVLRYVFGFCRHCALGMGCLGPGGFSDGSFGLNERFGNTGAHSHRALP